jgi:hypothetical protein
MQINNEYRNPTQVKPVVDMKSPAVDWDQTLEMIDISLLLRL